ncbi:hypothetical protein [Runella salmonicolor]|uniref:Uncharacterized protein n=1 Tax=Runella salmonicolor TaxID=2950278 RepID=A0ABT1FHN2_9BACT|nr:hypothetical protein [Runella salmonicolor]MCP1381244.1 hypothetical protein [Runella salmonicolor]
MKKIFSICLLTAYSTFAVEQPDSIIVNAGKNSRVIFYGKTQQDLKNIERLDLNKLLRDLNQKQDSAKAVLNHLQMSSESYQTTTTKPIPKWKQLWQNYKKNTFLNAHVGLGSYRFFGKPIGEYEYFRLTDPNVIMPNSGLTDFTMRQSLWLRTRSVVGISLLHDIPLINTSRMAFKFRYGLGIEALGLRFEYSNLMLINPISREFLESDGWRTFNNTKWQYIQGLGTILEQTDVRAMNYYAQIMPKLVLKDKKGRESFSFGLGVRLNKSSLKQPIHSGDPNNWGIYSSNSNPSGGGRTTWSEGPIVRAKEVFYVTNNSNAKSISFLAEAGYRNISLFANYTPAFTEISPRLRGNGTSTTAPFNTQSGKLGFVNFGVKFGR